MRVHETMHVFPSRSHCSLSLSLSGRVVDCCLDSGQAAELLVEEALARAASQANGKCGAAYADMPRCIRDDASQCVLWQMTHMRYTRI